MGRPEASIENYLAKRVKETRGNIRKCRWIGRRGCADRLVWWSNPLRAAWVEVKAPGKEVDWRGLQGREILRMTEDGWVVWVVDSREKVDEMLREVHG